MRRDSSNWENGGRVKSQQSVCFEVLYSLIDWCVCHTFDNIYGYVQMFFHMANDDSDPWGIQNST